ncbi:MAG: MucB/RseB C-terminal domain-containing protein [Gammaproteobacteria bacterium]
MTEVRRPVLLLAALLLTAAAQADTDARDWLRQMSQASQGLNYRGTFVYLHEGRLEAMRIIHRADADGEQERLFALTGAAREVLRDNQQVTCILPRHKAVMVDRSLPRKPFPAALPRDLDALSGQYEFLIDGEDRVSGLPTRIVVIRPRDGFRYGHRLWLDLDSSLPLRSALLDAEGQPVEQMMFTELEILDEVPAEDLQPMLRGEEYTRRGPVRHAEGGEDMAVDERGWVVTELPAGFMLTHYNRVRMPSAAAPVEHLVFSDGLATVSVYVEPRQAGAHGLSGHSSRGAVNALGTQRGDVQITVVGEVPRITVEQISQAVRPRP